MVVFLNIVDLIQYCHHAQDEGLPQVLRGQRVPEVGLVHVAVNLHAVHFEQLQGRGLKPELLIDRVELKDLLQLLEPHRQYPLHEWIVLNDSAHCQHRPHLTERYQPLVEHT